MKPTTEQPHQPPSARAAAAPVTSQSRATFPPADQLLQLHFCVNSNPSWPLTFLLAFQHYIVMLGSVVMIATILVPRMGGGLGDEARVINTMVFMSGLNTLLQTLIGTRLPTVMGPSFAYLISVFAIINDLSDRKFSSEHERFVHTMRAIQGSLLASSFINIILGFSRAWEKLTRLFSPVAIVPVVCAVGLGLFGRGFPQLAHCVEIGLPMLILLVVSQQYLKGIHPIAHPVLQRFALLLCIAFIWAFASILTVSGAYKHAGKQRKSSCSADGLEILASALWVRIPYPFQWGAPIFRASHLIGMMGAALVTSAESTGAFIAAARLSSATAPPTHVLTRSIGLQGVGQLLDGIFGAAVGTAASVENVGLLGLTHVGSRRVVQISAACMIFFSIFGKFGVFFASIPLPIYAAIYCVLYGIVAAIGISFIQFTNINSMRNIYILGLSLFLGLSMPQYFVAQTDMGHGPVRTNAGWFNDILNAIFSSPGAVAMVIATLLDNTLEVRKCFDDRGIPWWMPFQHKKGDSRNDEFYGFPLWFTKYVNKALELLRPAKTAEREPSA